MKKKNSFRIQGLLGVDKAFSELMSGLLLLCIKIIEIYLPTLFKVFA